MRWSRLWSSKNTPITAVIASSRRRLIIRRVHGHIQRSSWKDCKKNCWLNPSVIIKPENSREIFEAARFINRVIEDERLPQFVETIVVEPKNKIGMWIVIHLMEVHSKWDAVQTSKEIYGYATGRFRAYKVLCFNFSISRRILNVLNRKDDVALRWSKMWPMMARTIQGR